MSTLKIYIYEGSIVFIIVKEIDVCRLMINKNTANMILNMIIFNGFTMSKRFCLCLGH